MNARALFSSFYDFIDQVPSPKWLGIAATAAALVLLVGLIVLSDRYLRLRRRFSEQGEPGGASSHAGIAGWEDELAPISLEGERRAPSTGCCRAARAPSCWRWPSWQWPAGLRASRWQPIPTPS